MLDRSLRQSLPNLEGLVDGAKSTCSFGTQDVIDQKKKESYHEGHEEHEDGI